jgi:hypothetical protein
LNPIIKTVTSNGGTPPAWIIHPGLSDPLKIQISPTLASHAGSFLIEIEAELTIIPGTTYPIKGMFSLTIINEAPYFPDAILPLPDMEFPFNTPGTIGLPSPIDTLSSCQTITIQVNSDPIVSSFVGQTLNILATSYNDLGEHFLTITLSDSSLTTTYPFKVTITNKPPYFLADKAPPTDLTLHLNDLYLFDLHYSDKETPMQVLVSLLQMTSVMKTFIAISSDSKTLTINPVGSSAIGSHSLTVVLSDANLVRE